jgi:hypothetical protein
MKLIPRDRFQGAVRGNVVLREINLLLTDVRGSENSVSYRAVTVMKNYFPRGADAPVRAGPPVRLLH